jgi:glycosyltransferase involved in cell wall biosynthesis
LEKIVDQIIIVDSFSTDRTLSIAKEYQAKVVQHQWVNYATQFNWALTQLDDDTDWVLRLDADEYLTPRLVEEICQQLPKISPEIDAVFCNRRMIFQGKLIRYGGVFPTRVLRLFRYGRGQCEKRWMDEHIKVNGSIADFQGDIIDDNLNSLTWWTTKHNHYASREAVDLLNLEYGFIPHDSVASLQSFSRLTIKRWLKEVVYARLPSGFRSLAYFLYRYILCFGFLDGQAGTAFHFFQGFWYRYLVDTKVAEVKRYMREKNSDPLTAIEEVLNIKVDCYS